MKANELLRLYSGHAVMNDLLTVIDSDKPETRICIEGLSGSSKPLVSFSDSSKYTADSCCNNSRERRSSIFL